MVSRGRINWLQKEEQLYGVLWQNERISHLIYSLSYLFPNEFMVSIAGFKSSSIQHDEGNDGPF